LHNAPCKERRHQARRNKPQKQKKQKVEATWLKPTYHFMSVTSALSGRAGYAACSRHMRRLCVGLWHYRCLRRRLERRIQKHVRSLHHGQPQFIFALRSYKQQRTLAGALQEMMLNPEVGWYHRGTAGKLLALADKPGTLATLLDLFYAQDDKVELWGIALTLEHIGDHNAVPRLIDALYDDNPHRRHAAARALGWIQPVTRSAARALVRALKDKSQPQPVREEAAESLAYSNCPKAIEPLISVLAEPDVRMRFWAVFALGSIGRFNEDPRVIRALQAALNDEEIPPGNWWSVGREALAMLGDLAPEYSAQLDEEIRRVLNDANSSPEDLRWAEGYVRRVY
jgi:hypothetical protein